MGRTGAGKSTIFKLLLGLYEPQKGMVLIWGVPSVDLPDAKKRKVFGYVEQSFHMVPGSVKDQITLYDAKISDTDVKKAAELTGLAKTIEALPTNMIRSVHRISSHRVSGSSSRLPVQPQRSLKFCSSMRLPQTLMQRRKNGIKCIAKGFQNRTVISISHRTMAETGRVILIS